MIMDLYLSWLITAIMGGIAVYIMYRLAKIPNDYFENLGIPIVKSPPIFGVSWDLILMKKGLGEIIEDIYKKTDGQKIVGYNQFLNPVIMIRDPEIGNQILVKDFTYFEDRTLPLKGDNDLFTLGLNMLAGREWRNARYKLMPTFSSGKLKDMFEPIKECSDELIHYIENKPAEDFEARDLMLRYIINVIGNVAFGVKLDVLNETDKQSVEFFQMCSKVLQPSILLIVKILLSFSRPKIKELLKLKLIDKDVEAFFRRLIHDIIKQRKKSNTRRNDFLQIMLDLQKKELNNGLGADSNSQEGGCIDAEDEELMDQLKNTPLGSNIESKSETFTEDFISSQTFLFISGGSETTATVLSFILFELAVNQNYQKKVQEEISDVLNSQEFNYHAIKKFHYMEQFINEVFRLHPITSLLTRVCTREYKIPGTEITLQKGIRVNIPVGGFQMDAQYFPDPTNFNPDRFQDIEAIPKNVFYPFGGGPRICIAMRLAMLEMKIILAILLSNYNVVLSEKTKLPLKLLKKAMFPRVNGGMWIKFIRRDIKHCL